jgi:hypothetical protein
LKRWKDFNNMAPAWKPPSTWYTSYRNLTDQNKYEIWTRRAVFRNFVQSDTSTFRWLTLSGILLVSVWKQQKYIPVQYQRQSKNEKH